MRLRSLAQLKRNPSNAIAILDAMERDIRQYYPDDRGVSYQGKGRAYGRKLVRAQLKRIARAREALVAKPQA